MALAIHLANCALLYFIVKALWGQGPLAAVAALLFGLHGTRPEAVAWSAGNFDLLACAFTFAATLCALRRRTLAACAFVALAILSKESAYAAPAVMLGLAAAAGRVRESRTRNLLPPPQSVPRCSRGVGPCSTDPAATSTPPPAKPRFSRFISGAR